MREYIAVYEFNYYGKYIEEITFSSAHRANSKKNYEDALREIRKSKLKGIANSAIILNTYLVA